MKLKLTRNFRTAATATALAGALAVTSMTAVACNNSDDTEGTETTTTAEATTEKGADKDEDKDAETKSASTDEEKSEGSPKGIDHETKSDDKNVQEAAVAVQGFYKALFSTPIEGGAEFLNTLSEKMGAIAPELQTAPDDDPLGVLEGLTDSQRSQLLDLVEPEGKEVVGKFISTDGMSDAEKIYVNMIVLTFRSMSSIDEGFKDITFGTDQKAATTDKDSVTFPPSSIIAKAPDGTQSAETLPIPMVLVKDGKEWKIDGKKFASEMGKPLAKQAEAAQANIEK